MTASSGTEKTSKAVSKIRYDLEQLLKNHMRPNEYGDPLEFIYFELLCPSQWSTPKVVLKLGAYRSKSKEFSAELGFDESFADLPPKTRFPISKPT